MWNDYVISAFNFRMYDFIHTVHEITTHICFVMTSHRCGVACDSNDCSGYAKCQTCQPKTEMNSLEKCIDCIPGFQLGIDKDCTTGWICLHRMLNYSSCTFFMAAAKQTRKSAPLCHPIVSFSRCVAVLFFFSFYHCHCVAPLPRSVDLSLHCLNESVCHLVLLLCAFVISLLP